MLEARGDLWELPADARCITTNGFVKRNGRAVMGRGCAREARDRYAGLDVYLGMQINDRGNHVHILVDEGSWLLASFPVKHHWAEPADLALIERSCQELVDLANKEGWQKVLLPRPGCGNGQLAWEDVKPRIEGLLDDRVVVVTF